MTDGDDNNTADIAVYTVMVVFARTRDRFDRAAPFVIVKLQAIHALAKAEPCPRPTWSDGQIDGRLFLNSSRTWRQGERESRRGEREH